MKKPHVLLNELLFGISLFKNNVGVNLSDISVAGIKALQLFPYQERLLLEKLDEYLQADEPDPNYY